MTEADRTLLIVGASSDIGCALLSKLDGLYGTVFAHCHRSEAKLQSLAARLETPRVRILRADLRSEGDLARMVEEVRGAGASPDGFVFLAAPKYRVRRFKDTTWREFQEEIDVQLAPTVRLLKEFMPPIAKRGRGKVVFALSSVTAGVPPIGVAAYATVKHGLLGLMRALAAEYSSRRININAISPSMTDTKFLDELPARMVEISAQQSHWGRNARVEEVAGAVRFLLSPESDYMTGVNLLVTGGSVF